MRWNRVGWRHTRQLGVALLPKLCLAVVVAKKERDDCNRGDGDASDDDDNVRSDDEGAPWGLGTAAKKDKKPTKGKFTKSRAAAAQATYYTIAEGDGEEDDGGDDE